MQNQTVRLFLYSSLAIVALTLVWGFRNIPKQGALAEEQLRSSLEQELIVLTSAVKASTTAMKFRLLDVLKAEGNDHATRAFQDSPFAASALLEWDGSQWKMLWNSSKLKDQFQAASLREWMKEWPLAKIANEEAYFAKVADVEGQAYFALIVPVRKPNNTPMLGIGVFPAGQFGLTFAADHTREVRVFDSLGFALALGHPAYVGASLKREPVVAEILDGDAVSVREEWKSEQGVPILGLATRLSDSNLFAALETNLPLGRSWVVQAWMYLILCAMGAIGLNWFLFSSLVRPLLAQLGQTEEALEKMRRLMTENPVGASAPAMVLPSAAAGDQAIPSAELPNVAFLEIEGEPEEAAPVPVSTPMAKVVAGALRNLEPRLKDLGISVNRVGLQDVDVAADVLQLQTAIEEVLKNAVESMADAPERQLTIRAHRAGSDIALTVEDTGCGIAPENVKKVFDPFFSTKDSQGVARGLGLNVVRRVVEELHGTVNLRNRQGGPGVVVDLEWPAHKPEVRESAAPAAPAPQTGFELDLLEDEADAGMNEEFSTVRISKEWPQVPIRKPKVRTLD